MSTHVIKNEKYQTVLNVFGNLKEMIENHGFDLLQDDNLKSFIQNCYEKFKIKIDSKTTVCAIFDPRSNHSSLIDMLLKEDVSWRLTPDAPYLVKGISKWKKLHIDEDVPVIKTISVPTKRWKTLENSLILLCSKNYMDFMTTMKTEINFEPDVVVLVINSPGDLKIENIKSFLSKTGKAFNHGNFLLVLNDAAALDCASVDYCDVCYPDDTRTFLRGTGIQLEDKYFQISSSTYCSETEDGNYLEENFKKLKKSLEMELNMETVIERFYKEAMNINCSMTNIKKSFDEKKLKESINQINSKLKDHAPVVKKTIDNYGNKTNNEALETLKTKPQNNNLNVGAVMKPFMEDKIKQLEEELRKDLKILIENDKNKEEHKKFSNMVNNMFYNQMFNEHTIEESFHDYLNIDAMKYKVNDLQNKENEDISAKNSSWLGFVDGTKKFVNIICNKAKDAYDGLVSTFKETVENLVEKVKSTVNQMTNLLRNDFLQHFIDKCKLLTTITEDERKKMLNTLDQSISLIKASIRQKDKVDIYDSNIGRYISNVVCDSTRALSLTSVRDQLYAHMILLGYDTNTIDLSNEFAGIYCDKYFPCDIISKFDSSCCREFTSFQELINEKRFYNYENVNRDNLSDKVDFRTAIIAGAATGAVGGGIAGFGIFSPLTAALGGITGALVGLRGAIATQDALAYFEEKGRQKTKKFIKVYEMMAEVENLKNTMQAMINEVMATINCSIKDYLEFMKNMHNIQN